MHVLLIVLVIWIVRAGYGWTQRSDSDRRARVRLHEAGASPAAQGMPARPPLGDYQGDTL